MLKHAAVCITVSTAVLYTLGLTFHLGFLSELGIEETQFPLSLDRTLFQGFVSFTHMGVKGIGWLLLAVESVVFVSFTASFVINLAKRSNWWENKSATLTEKKDESSKPPQFSFIQFSLKMFFYSAALFFVFMGTLLCCYPTKPDGNLR